MAMMSSKKHQELEGRLEDMLSRIAMETLEIKHLEQQLTEGQILVCQAQDEACCLGTQNQALQRQLEATQHHCRQLETEAITHRQQFHGGLDLLFEALVSGQDGFRSNGLEEMLSDRLRQMYQDIQQYVAEQIQRAQEQVQQNHNQQNPDKQMQGEKLREELKEARSSLQNSQAQVQHLQHTMAELSRRQKLSRSMSESQRYTDQRIRWTTQQLRALSDTLEQLEPHQEARDSGLGLHYLSSPERGRCDIRLLPRVDYIVDGNPTDTGYSAEEEVGHSWSSGGPATGVSAGIADSQEPLCGCSATPACNLPEHTDLERKRVEEERKRVEEERKMLHLEMKQLRCVCLCEEVQCVEQTLLKRRAELRQADRRLLDAQSCLHYTRHKARCVQKQLVLSQSELQGLDHRLEESATCLLETKQQLWETEEELQENLLKLAFGDSGIQVGIMKPLKTHVSDPQV
ncbi:Centriolin [Merluccius polli]|uniref:Centriolin n=1 Tax=Merluccius polli TaxID=89951 RepID=A0AA47NQ45_MERPO|nr:Centriolin [Merluccius polli]